MNKTHVLTFIVTVLLMFGTSQIVFAHVCSDVINPSSGQYGCPDPVYTTNTAPSVNGNLVSFDINVKNRRVEYYGYTCHDLGLDYCYENENYYGNPGCNTNPWTGSLTNARVELASCSPTCDLSGCPDCDFDVSISPVVRRAQWRHYLVATNSVSNWPCFPRDCGCY